MSLKVWMGVCPYYGPSIHSIADKYREYSPEEEIQWVDDWLEADVCIDHIIGEPDRDCLVHPLERSFSEDVKARLEMAEAGAIKLAPVIHCNVNGGDFYYRLMGKCLVATGFLDLPKIMCEDSLKRRQDSGIMISGYPPIGWWTRQWLRVSWGVDPSDFLLPHRKEKPDFLIYTWGAAADPEVEYIKTIYDAVKTVGGRMLHSGLDYKFDNGDHYEFLPPASTSQEVARRYNLCWFANAMRAESGFEMGNIEAPLSNARPITLGREDYWYHFKEGNVSEFVYSCKPKEELELIFMERKRPITVDEKRFIIEKFNWRKTITPFWERIINGTRI